MKNNELERVGEELEKTIKSSDTIEEVLKKSSEIDQIIINEVKKYQKFEEMLELKEKHNIIKSIKEDILKYVSDISLIDLEIMSNTIYIYCVLKLYGVKTKDIFEYGVYINGQQSLKFFQKLDSGEEENGLLNDNFYMHICKKYIDIIKGRLIK